MSGISGGVTVLSGFTSPNDDQTVVQLGGNLALSTSISVLKTQSGGKVAYITSVSVGNAGTVVFLTDNGVDICAFASPATGGTIYALPTPIAFSTNIGIRAVSGTPTVATALLGFEQ